jgi:Chaperone of endosialidase
VMDIWNTHAYGIDASNATFSVGGDKTLGYFIRGAGFSVTGAGTVGIDSNSDGALLLFSDSGTNKWGLQQILSDSTNRLRIWDYANSTERVTFLNSGNVGIATTNPSLARLQVTGGTGQHGIYSSTADSGSSYYGVQGVAGSYWGALGRADGWAFVGVGNAWVTGTYQMPSDGRLKEDFHDLANSLDKVMQLRPVSFHWKHDSEAFKAAGSARQFGLVAQDVQQVIPEIVILNKKPPISPTGDGKESLDARIGESYGLDYTKIIPFLIGAVQEQQTEIERLKAALDHR